MPSHRRKLLPLCIAASLFSGASLPAAAIGIGEIHVESFLGTPLQAEVPLSHLGDLDVSQLKVQLGSQSDYAAMGVEYLYLHSQLKIEPFIKNGEGYLRISTREPVAEPYVNFVLSLRWPQGQLVREFTVLLDPPSQAAAVSVPAPAAEREEVAAAMPSDIDPQIAAPAPRKTHSHSHRSARIDQPTPTDSAPSPVAGEHAYIIQRGDSLWRIANRLHERRAPVEQVMAAIRALNPSAFINGDPNLLKEAATLRLPDRDQIVAASTAVPAANAQSTSAEAPRLTQPARSAQPFQSAEEVADRVKPVAKDNSAEVGQLVEENSTLKSQVGELTNNVAVLNQNLTQSEQRLHQLESQLNDLLQQMQQQRATIASLSGNTDTHAAPLAQSTGSVINQVNAADLHGGAPARTPWWVHLLYWLGIGGAMTWAVREHFWPQRRLAAAAIGGQAPRDESIPNAGKRKALGQPFSTLDAPAGTSETPINIATVADAAELTLDLDDLPLPPDTSAGTTHAFVESDIGEAAPELMKPSGETVDPSISAGVFLAFGRFAEAEQLLREALLREPRRVDLKLQLLDVLMQSDQPGAFDDLAADIENEASTPETLAELAVLRDSYRPRH